MIKLGRYELVKRLARGGMAELLLARQAGPEGFEKLLVIKRLLPTLSDQEDIVRMFLNEARIAARLTHPNIVQIFDLGKTGREFFIAMEYVRGRDLRAVQKAADKQEHPMPYELSAYVLTCVCRGLHHAHTLRDSNGESLGLVHRDVSPHNVLLSFSGDVKLADFGIAKATALAAETQAGVLKGKFAYMSPEQIRGEELDARSDVFSAGILLHELVCWQRLFRRETDFATIRAVESDTVPPPSVLRDDVPDALERVVMRALERDPDRRYSTAQEMQMDLEGVISDLGWRCGPVELASFLTGLFWRRITDQVSVGTGLGDSHRPVAQPLVRPASGSLNASGEPFPAAAPPARAERSRRSRKRTRSAPAPAHAEPVVSHIVSHPPEVLAPGTLSGAQTHPLPPGGAAASQPPHGRSSPSSEARALLDELQSVEDAPPTVIQPPDFADVLRPAAEQVPAQPPSEHARQHGALAPGALAHARPDVGLSQRSGWANDESYRGPFEASESNEEFYPDPQALSRHAPPRSDRTLHVLLLLGIVLSLSLTVAILALIAFN